MPYYNGFFTVIPVVKLIPDPDQVFFLLLIQGNTGLYSRVAEIIIPDTVIERKIPDIIQPVPQRFGPQRLQLRQSLVPAVDQPLTGTVQEAYIQFVPGFCQGIEIIQHLPLMIAHKTDDRFRMLLLQMHDIIQTLQRFRSPVHKISQKNQHVLGRIKFDAAHQRFQFFVLAVHVAYGHNAAANHYNPRIINNLNKYLF